MEITQRPPQLETLSGARHRAFEIKRFRKPRFDFIWHHHPESELTYIIRGHGVRYVGNSILPFCEGDLCLIGPNLPHAYGSHPKSGEGAEWLVIHFLAGNWGNNFWGLPENRVTRELLALSARGLCFGGGKLAEAVSRIEAFADLHDKKRRTGGIPQFLDVLEQIALLEKRQILNTSQTVDKNKGRGIDPRLSKILSWVQEHSGGDISQPEVAALIGMSPAAFSRYFHSNTGRVFSRYLNEIRIARACALLAATRQSITEIAGESGFNNLPNFNRRFREIVQMTPGEYRNGIG